MAKTTPFYEDHKKLNARIIDFGGYDMPVSYSGIKEEHRAVRNSVGMFDVSHMGEFVISGEEALPYLQYIITNDASKLTPGKALYTVMCKEGGGIVDDLLVYMLDENRYMLVVNAANIDKDFNWIASQNNFNARLINKSEDTCLLAVQGPESLNTLQKLTDTDLKSVSFYNFTVGSLAGYSNVILSATGYTGEKGFELYFDKEEAAPSEIWNAILEAGKEFDIKPAGLGARDTLRLEMGLALYGNDIDETTNPYEAKLNWLVKPDKGNFIGKKELLKIKEKGVERKLTGFEMPDNKKIPRKDYEICDEKGEQIGRVTSGGLSVTLDKGIGMGYISKEYQENKNNIFVSIRKNLVEAKLVAPPFIEK